MMASLYAAAFAAYDEGMAQVTMLYSSAAYCWPPKVRAWAQGGLTDTCQPIFNFELNETFSVHSKWFDWILEGFAYTGVDHERQWVVAAFKGTNDTLDWVADIWGLEFDFEPCKLPSNMTAGRVHTGFCDYYAALANLGVARAYLELLALHPTYSAVVTGHSLGGAAASLFAYDVFEASAGALRPRLQTFGMPRVGDYDFSSALSSRVLTSDRVVHRADVVPHLPLCVGMGNCSDAPGDPYHYGTEVWYTGDVSAGTNYTVCDGSGEDPRCSNSKFPSYSASDHCKYFGQICGACCKLL